MGEIISGQVSFSKTVKTGDFENEKADCRLDFNVAEGETCDGILDLASDTAKAKVYEMLGKGKAAARLPAQLQTTTEQTQTSGATKADLAAAAAATVGAPKSGTAEAAPKAAKKPPAQRKVVEDPKPEEPPKAADDDGMADLLGAAPAPITDAEMLKIVQDTNARIKNAQAIRELTGRYVQPPKGVKDVPQELRAKYVEELAALKPAGA